MDFSIIKRREAKHPYCVLIFFLILFFTSGLFSQNANPTKPAPTEKNESVGTITILNGNSTKNDSSSVVKSIIKFRETELILETFVKEIDNDFSAILKAQRSSPDSEFLMPYTRNFIKTDFPRLWKRLNDFFSQENGCMWFYICEKEKPYGGSLIYAFKIKDLYYDGGFWDLTNYLFRGKLSDNVIYIRNIIDDNLALKKGYVWYNDEKIFVRPRQSYKVLTGKCIYLFGFGDSPIYYDPDSSSPITTYISDDSVTTTDTK